MSKNESKTIKEALKEAREHIDKKDFRSGLKCCKRALNVDKANYMALIFYGLCSTELEQYDQAQQVTIFHLKINLGFYYQILILGLQEGYGGQPGSIDSMARVCIVL